MRALYEDRQGTLWVGTGSPELTDTPVGEGGLNRFDPVTQGHGGTLEVESQKGEGATFVVRLPAES